MQPCHNAIVENSSCECLGPGLAPAVSRTFRHFAMILAALLLLLPAATLGDYIVSKSYSNASACPAVMGAPDSIVSGTACYSSSGGGYSTYECIGSSSKGFIQTTYSTSTCTGTPLRTVTVTATCEVTPASGQAPYISPPRSKLTECVQAGSMPSATSAIVSGGNPGGFFQAYFSTCPVASGELVPATALASALSIVPAIPCQFLILSDGKAGSVLPGTSCGPWGMGMTYYADNECKKPRFTVVKTDWSGLLINYKCSSDQWSGSKSSYFCASPTATAPVFAPPMCNGVGALAPLAKPSISCYWGSIIGAGAKASFGAGGNDMIFLMPPSSTLSSICYAVTAPCGALAAFGLKTASCMNGMARVFGGANTMDDLQTIALAGAYDFALCTTDSCNTPAGDACPIPAPAYTPFTCSAAAPFSRPSASPIACWSNFNGTAITSLALQTSAVPGSAFCFATTVKCGSMAAQVVCGSLKTGTVRIYAGSWRSCC